MKEGNHGHLGGKGHVRHAKPSPPPDPQKEHIYPLKELGRYIGFELPYNTIRNWHRRGLVNPHSRQRVRIGVVRMTYGLGTSIEEYWRFIDKLNEGAIDSATRSG